MDTIDEKNINKEVVTPRTEVNSSKKKVLTWLAVAIIVLILVLVASPFVLAKFTQGKADANATSTVTNAELIKQVVETIQSKNKFPVEVDANTTWTGFSAGENSVRYEYMLHGLDTTNMNNDTLKAVIVPKACSSVLKAGALDRGIALEYAISLKESTSTYFFTITSADCQ